MPVYYTRVPRPEDKLIELLEENIYVGPDQPATFILDKLNSLKAPWDYDLSLAVIRWLGTYLTPESKLVLPVPPERDFFVILDVLFNNLPAGELLEMLEEGRVRLEKTLASVQAVRPKEVNSLDNQREWKNELVRRLANLSLLIERAEHNASIEALDDGFGVVKIYCPICQKRNDLNYGIMCEHYICSLMDGYSYYWSNGMPHFFNEVDQLNRSLNRPKTTPELFESLLGEAPTEIRELFQSIRENGASFWTSESDVLNFYWDSMGMLTFAWSEYFHNTPESFIARIKSETKAGLTWLERHHPELLVKAEEYQEQYEDKYSHGYDEWNSEEDDLEESL